MASKILCLTIELTRAEVCVAHRAQAATPVVRHHLNVMEICHAGDVPVFGDTQPVAVRLYRIVDSRLDPRLGLAETSECFAAPEFHIRHQRFEFQVIFKLHRTLVSHGLLEEQEF